MKIITVTTKQPVRLDNGKQTTSLDFCTITGAKKWIKANIDNYKSSCIYKMYANGDMVNLGSISINADNKKYVANTRQQKQSYA